MKTPAKAWRRLLIKHTGNLRGIARSLKCSHQAVSQQLAKHRLTEFAAGLRSAAGVRGPRGKALVGERERIVAALRGHSITEAASVLGCSRFALYRKLKQYKITQRAARPRKGNHDGR